MEKMNGVDPIAHQRLFRYLILLLALLSLFYGFNGVLPHQLTGMPLFDISIDNSFWLFHFTGLASKLHRHPLIIYSLEAAFVLLMVSGFLSWRQSTALLMLLIAVVLSLYLQTYSCTLTKISAVLPAVIMPFCVPLSLYRLALKFPRYYLVYLMVTAAVFKWINGGLAHPWQMEQILYAQHVDLRLFGDNALQWDIASFLIRHHLATAGYVAIFLLELSFIGLLFTQKWDRLYLLLLLFFCGAIFLTMRINTAELCLLAIPLLGQKLKNH